MAGRACAISDEGKVPAASRCETFVALRTEVQNWRWAGVPFYLRTGKRLAERDAQIVVNFRPTPHSIFPGASTAEQAGHQAAARGRARTAPAGRQGQRPGRSAGAGLARPRFRQGVRRKPRRRLRAAAARGDRRPAEPVRAQRRTGTGMALGRADPASLAARRRILGGPSRMQRAHGARPRPARWLPATASPGRKSNDPGDASIKPARRA